MLVVTIVASNAVIKEVTVNVKMIASSCFVGFHSGRLAATVSSSFIRDVDTGFIVPQVSCGFEVSIQRDQTTLQMLEVG